MLKTVYLYIKNVNKKEYDSLNLDFKKQEIDLKLWEPGDEIAAKEGILVSDVYYKDECISTDLGLGEHFNGPVAYVVYELLDITPEFCQEVYARKMNIPLVISRTEDFTIREIEIADLPALYDLYKTVQDCEFIEPLYEYEEEKEFTVNYIENMYRFFGYGLWLVFDNKTGELVARAGIENRSIDGNNCQELGYIVRKDRQRNGLATAICEEIIRLAEHRYAIDRLFICTDKNNIPSIALSRKLGFKLYASDVDGMNLYVLNLQ